MGTIVPNDLISLLGGVCQGAHGTYQCRDLAPAGDRLGGVAPVLEGVARRQSTVHPTANARVGNTASVRREPGGTSGSIHGLGYLFGALRREGLIADELVLQLATFLRSLDLFLELTLPALV